MQRYGSVIGIKSEKIEEYKILHANVWPEILNMIQECNMQNYSIFLRQIDNGDYYMFSYFEYIGNDFAGDMKKMAGDPKTQEWWGVCGSCQKPLESRKEGEWWASMEQVFHCD